MKKTGKRQKYLIPMCVAVALVLASCSQPTPTSAPTSTPVPQAQVTPAAPDCTVASTVPTLGPTETSLFPQPEPEDWVMGPATAAVTILEYSDFQ